MSKKHITRSTLLGVVRTTAENYVKEFVPSEHPYFCMIWDEMLHPLSESSERITSDNKMVPILLDSVAAFNKSQRLKLVAPALIMTLEAVVIELGTTTETPTVQDINQAIAKCAPMFGISKPTALHLGERLSKPLHDSLSSMLPLLQETPKTMANKQAAAALIEQSKPWKPPSKSELQRREAWYHSLKYPFSELIVTRNERMIRALEQLQAYIERQLDVLLIGETGTGKDLVASVIHSFGRPNGKNIVTVNCGAISQDLIESELFGTCKGAYTEAPEKPGKFEEANGGTIFLDDIEAMPIVQQPTLLTILEQKQRLITRVGGRKHSPADGCKQGSADHRNIKLDLTIVTATNERLENLVKQGLFRHDLQMRLERFVVYLPPLRDRAEDIEPLANHFLSGAETTYGLGKKRLNSRSLKFLITYDWPGNVRQLKNVIERAYFLAASSGTITAKELDQVLIAEGAPATQEAKNNGADREFQTLVSIYQSIPEDSPDRFKQAYTRMGISRSTAYRLCQRNGTTPGKL